MKKKVCETKKSYIGTKDPPLSAKCSTSNMKNYHHLLTDVQQLKGNNFNGILKKFGSE